jgi:hypothetical protein
MLLVLPSSRRFIVLDEYRKLANIITTAVFTSAVLATSVLLAEPVNKEAQEVEKDPDQNEEAESRKGATKDSEQAEAEQGACGAD